jgi:hypothetical protein
MSFVSCLDVLVFFKGFESLYTSIAESYGIYIYIYIYKACCRWDYMYVFPSGRLKHLYIFTAT